MEATPAVSAVPEINQIPADRLATAAGVTGNQVVAVPDEKPPEPKVEPKPEPSAAPRFAELAKKEKALSIARMKLGEERKAVDKQRAEMAELKSLVENAQLRPIPFLKKTFGDNWPVVLAKLEATGEVPNDIIARSVDEKLAAFEKKQVEAQEAQQKAAQEAQEAEAAQLRANLADECRAFVDSKPDDYELIAIHGSHALVPQLIEEEYKRTGKLLTSKAAADAVETYLTGQVEKAAASKKLAARFLPQAKRTPAATLTNDLAASTPVPKSAAKTEEERMARAIAAWEQVEKARKA